MREINKSGHYDPPAAGLKVTLQTCAAPLAAHARHSTQSSMAPAETFIIFYFLFFLSFFKLLEQIIFVHKSMFLFCVHSFVIHSSNPVHITY